MDLDNLKYADLQRLAKEVGLKANLKADKLLKALKQHYEQQDGSLPKSEKEEVIDKTQNNEEHDVSTTNDPVHEQADFVTKRRGRGQKAKRKQEDIDDHVMKLSPRPEGEGSLIESDGRPSSKRKRTSLETTLVVAPVVTKTENQPEQAVDPASNETVPEAPAKEEEKPLKQPGGKIPRAIGLLNKSKAAKRPITPNFKKLHEAHFKKMESIDAYVERKNKTIQSFRNTVVELKALSETTNLKSMEAKTNTKPKDGKTQAKAKVNRSSLFSPAAREKKPVQDKARVTQLLASKPALKSTAVFKPTVVSTAKINVRFSKGTQDNEHKRSLIKTPARMSPHITLTSTPARSTTMPKTGANTSVLNVSKTPGTTPFVFSGNTSMSTTPHGSKKNAFDLKASLSRPLTYKPHKGKLKPFGETQDNTLNKSQTVPSHQKNYKQHKVQTREDRRVKQTEDRKQKKEKMLGAKRGLVMT